MRRNGRHGGKSGRVGRRSIRGKSVAKDRIGLTTLSRDISHSLTLSLLLLCSVVPSMLVDQMQVLMSVSLMKKISVSNQKLTKRLLWREVICVNPEERTRSDLGRAVIVGGRWWWQWEIRGRGREGGIWQQVLKGKGEVTRSMRRTGNELYACHESMR